MALFERFLFLFTSHPMPAKTKAASYAYAFEKVSAEFQPVLNELAGQVMAKSYGTKLSELPAYQTIRSQDAAYQGQVTLALATAMYRCKQDDYQLRYTLGDVLGALMRGTLQLTDDDYLRLFALYGLQTGKEARTLYIWPFPLNLTLSQLARHVKKNGLGNDLQQWLETLLQDLDGLGGDWVKTRLKVQEILNKDPDSADAPKVVFNEGDEFGRQLNAFVSGSAGTAPAPRPWLHLLQLWQKVSGAQPSAKLRKELDTAITEIGPDAVRDLSRSWLELLVRLPVHEETHTQTYNNNQTYTYTTHQYLLEDSITAAKGLIWTVQPLVDDALRALLARLAVKCYQKIPGRGPLAAGLGNACLLTLAQNGLPGVSALAQVRGKIRQSNTQDLIARHIEKASQDLGVSPAEIEDMAVPDFGLENGQVVSAFGDYAATLTLTDGKAEIHWTKDDKALKSTPAALKAEHAEELKDLKAQHTQLLQTYTAQRDRLDRSFVEGRRIPWLWFEQYYFGHGLQSQLASPLIWRLHRADGSFQDALWLDGSWQDAHNQAIPAPTTDTQLQLWHPVLAPADEVLAWRALLETRQLRQPLKQAYREVYLLTPPEERTRTYSNRMAAHILKQHQFNSLAKLRGWKYSLMGAYDKGYESDAAVLALPAHGLQAEFWVSEVNADGAWNDTGIYFYVSTDQVRFVRGQEPVALTEVDKLAFSEVMRDVDLFVGVASVGNDPLWRDNGGLAQYRNYWESYSFGELGEVAKNRKMALERLVPRLKIGRVSEIKGNFLVVKGHRHTYKIHLGSGNILMEPGDRYLCIVPDRSTKTMGPADVFLPFEGDAVLSIILSKALLLMDDDKITDETILRQL